VARFVVPLAALVAPFATRVRVELDFDRDDGSAPRSRPRRGLVLSLVVACGRACTLVAPDEEKRKRGVT
jgi:hypothetical protein